MLDTLTLREQAHIIAALKATIKDLKELAECPTCGTVRKDMEEERFEAKLHRVQTGCNGSPHKCGDFGD
jgi:ssDNA-binding Zn-finger/Zn-ribbon topoisomerase 1